MTALLIAFLAAVVSLAGQGASPLASPATPDIVCADPGGAAATDPCEPLDCADQGEAPDGCAAATHHPACFEQSCSASAEATSPVDPASSAPGASSSASSPVEVVID